MSPIFMVFQLCALVNGAPQSCQPVEIPYATLESCESRLAIVARPYHPDSGILMKGQKCVKREKSK